MTAWTEPTRLQLLEVEYLIAVTAQNPGTCATCTELNVAMAIFCSTPVVEAISDGIRMNLHDVGRRHLLAEHNYAHKIAEASR